MKKLDSLYIRGFRAGIRAVLDVQEKTERAKASPKPLDLARFRAFFDYKNFTYFYKKYLDKL